MERCGNPLSKPVLVLLHGMFGAAENWRDCADYLGRRWEVRVPEIPVWDMPRAETGVHSLVAHLERWLDAERIDRAVLGGNSLGGHIALALALQRPERVEALVLVGSSGLFERGLESQTPRRPTREWIRAKIRNVFFEESHVTDALVDHVLHTVSDYNRLTKIVRMAKSAKQDNVRDVLHQIHCPVLLVWGADDTITPSDAAHEFKKHIPHAELEFINQCGHAPNIERPLEVSAIMDSFLARHCACATAG